MPEFAIAEDVLHGHIHHVGAFQGVAGLEGAIPDFAGFQVAQSDTAERLTLAGLDEFVLDDGAGVAIEHHFQAGLEFTGRIVGHKCCSKG